MIEIDDPPDIRACAACTSPISWLYSARTRTWVAFAHVPDDRLTLRVHTCRLAGSDAKPWRHLVAQPPEVAMAGLALVRPIAAAAAAKAKSSTEEGAP